MKRILIKLIKPLYKSPEGEPLFLNKLFYLGIINIDKHKWTSGNIKKDDVVLDVGAKRFPFTIYHKCKALFGLDLPSESGGYLGWKKDELSKLSSKPALFPIYGNCEEMPFADNSFDKIVMIEVIEHVEKDEKAIAELSRVLKPGGTVFITTPNGGSVENNNPYHFRHYLKNDLENKLEKHFDTVDVQIKYPNTKLLERRVYPKKTKLNRIKSVFWILAYKTWYHLFNKRYPNEGYLLVAEAGNFKGTDSDIASPKEYAETIRCPKCKSLLDFMNNDISKTNALKCKSCTNSYDVEDGVPFLITEQPHHQIGGDSPHIEMW